MTILLQHQMGLILQKLHLDMLSESSNFCGKRTLIRKYI